MHTVAISRVPETCFRFPKLLTRTFEYYRVNTEGECAIIPPTNIITVLLLHKIQMNDVAIAQILGEQQEAVEQEERQPTDQQESSFHSRHTTFARVPRHSLPLWQQILDY